MLVRQYVVSADVHPHVAGVSFADVWQDRIPGRFRQTDVCFPSLDDLIAMKEAAGRPKDQEDLRQLRLIRDRKKKQG